MIIFFILFILGLVGTQVHKRYIPVKGVAHLSEVACTKDILLLDTRDYPTAYKEPFEGSINIPYAYLKRYHQELPSKKILIIAADRTEKNLAIRFLRKNGFQILGYKISNTEGDMNHGIQQTDYQACKNY